MWCETNSLEASEIAQFDRVVQEVLAEACWSGPPIDVLEVARRLGMTVACDARQDVRGRHVRIRGRSAIFVRPEPRPERLQWTVAHEIGEAVLHRLAAEASRAGWEGDGREQRANLFATRLLLPEIWWRSDALQAHGDLYQLKARYSTASHELIAWRWLDLGEPAITSVVDQGKLTRRRSNRPGTIPPWSRIERSCLAEVQATGRPAVRHERNLHVAAWPVHEPQWRREIVRLTWEEDAA